MRDAEFAKTYVTNMRAWKNILKDAIVQGCKSDAFQYKDPARVARQLFALANGYADELLLQPSDTAVKRVLEEVPKAASVLLGKQL